MQVVNEYPDGIFSWVDLTTTDVPTSKAFYSGLFGWEADDVPTDVGNMYTMMKIEGYNVAGMGPMPPDMQNQGMPPYWGSYVNSHDVDAAVARATTAGGTAVMPPMDIMEEGRMALVQDPTGAVFGIWQPKNHTGAQLVNRENTLVWNELATRDADAAKAFYNAVFGWESRTDENNYTIFTAADTGRQHAGMMLMDETWGDIPPNWGVYFMVSDINAAAEKAVELGGTLVMPVTPAGDMGKFAVVSDPAGAVFMIMQFDGPVDPPPGY